MILPFQISDIRINSMYTDTEGFIFRQTKTVNGRRMILLFSRKYGKISAGTGISEKGRSKSSLAMRPFTYGRYELYKSRSGYNINGAETIRSYYKIGEDVDKYMNASYVLEFTEKVLSENVPQPKQFDLLLDFFDVLESRKKKYGTLVLAYEFKTFDRMGYLPELSRCVECGKEENLHFLDIEGGGALCRQCGEKKIAADNDSLIYEAGLGIIKIMRYFLSNPLKRLENLALEDDVLHRMRRMTGEFARYHLDIGQLNSQMFLSDN